MERVKNQCYKPLHVKMVERNEAIVSSALTSGAIAGTYLLAKSVPMLNTEGALAITIFSASFTLSYTGMRGYLPF